jgi:hypothetical protein
MPEVPLDTECKDAGERGVYRLDKSSLDETDRL